MIKEVSAGQPISAGQTVNPLIKSANAGATGQGCYQGTTGQQFRNQPASGIGMDHCVVREVYGSVESPSKVVTVQFINLTNGNWVADGDVVDAIAKPGRYSHHYAPFVWIGTVHQEQTRFLPAFYIGGQWRLGFEFDMDPQFLPASARITDCRPFTAATGV